jgi:hypothetical protein
MMITAVMIVVIIIIVSLISDIGYYDRIFVITIYYSKYLLSFGSNCDVK